MRRCTTGLPNVSVSGEARVVLRLSAGRGRAKVAKVFCFFFSKKKALLLFTHSGTHHG
jgi:hypothetical protein